MQISDILLEKGKNVITIDADQSIHDAIDMLNEHRIGALVVMGESKQVAGIITERDILRKCGNRCLSMSEHRPPEQNAFTSLVQDTMTKELVIGVPDDDPNYAMGVMTKSRIRHLPILDQGSLVGIVSIGDLVNVHLEEKVFESRTLKEYLERNATAAQV